MKARVSLLVCLAMLLSLFPSPRHARAADTQYDIATAGILPESCGHGQTFVPYIQYRNSHTPVRITVASAYVTGTGFSAPAWTASADIGFGLAVAVYFQPFRVKADASASGDTLNVTMTAKVQPLDPFTLQPAGPSYMLTERTATLTVAHQTAQYVSVDGATHAARCICGRDVGEAAPHEWDAGILDKTGPYPSGCPDMVRIFTCVLCGATKTENAMLQHWVSAWSYDSDNCHHGRCFRCGILLREACENYPVVTLPTCTEGGFTALHCLKCYFSTVIEHTPPAGHMWGSWFPNGDGTHRQSCMVTSHTQTEPCAYMDAVTPPACTAPGFTAHACGLCGDSFTDTPTAATGHTWGAWAANGDGTHTRACLTEPAHTETASCAYADTVTPPTCTAGGYTTHACADCGQSHPDGDIKPLGHDWQEWAANHDGTHARACGNDRGHAESGSCQYADSPTPPTCTEGGYTIHTCFLCGYYYAD
ncbi:MAG TPA: hypothetical protein VLA21_10155, partial [Candidatus Limnocylindria bacterium]|nr:hypothetical protein [Candidatus Limnocylindria bacterium]